MTKILIQSKDLTEARKISHMLEDYYFSAQVSFGRQSTYNQFVHESPEIFIYCCNTINSLVLDYVVELRNRGFKLPIILVVENVGSSDKFIKNHSGVHVIERKYISISLRKLCLKLSEKPKSLSQIFKRYSTDLSLEIENLYDGRGVSSRMINLSLGGAQCLSEKDPKFHEGDLVRLKIKLEEVDRFHNMNAKVVWINEDAVTGQMGFGLEFISEHDLYTQLIERI